MGMKERVATRYLQAKIQVTEQGDRISVIGPYAEMQAIYPKLKTWGFLYNGVDRSWNIENAKLTGIKRKRFEELLGLDKPKQTPRTFDPDTNIKLFRSFPPLATFSTGSRFDGSLLFTSPHMDKFKADAQAAGGEWNGVGWLFTPTATDPDKFQDLVDKMKAVDRQVQQDKENQVRELGQKSEAIERVIGGKNHRWTQANIVIGRTPGALSVFLIQGNTYAYKDAIKDAFDRPRFGGDNTWEVSVTEPLGNFTKFMALMDKAETAVVPKAQPAPTRNQQVNRKRGTCNKCGGDVQPGDGWLIHTYDNEGGSGDMIWLVEHKDIKVCEKIIADRKELLRIRSNKARAIKELREYAEKHGQYIKGIHRLQGERIYVSDKNLVIHGGGEWVQIEPDGRHFWYVRNNGADGDNWASNNVETGGAGAIGRQVPMTDDAKLLIQAIDKD